MGTASDDAEQGSEYVDTHSLWWGIRYCGRWGKEDEKNIGMERNLGKEKGNIRGGLGRWTPRLCQPVRLPSLYRYRSRRRRGSSVRYIEAPVGEGMKRTQPESSVSVMPIPEVQPRQSTPDGETSTKFER